MAGDLLRLTLLKLKGKKQFLRQDLMGTRFALSWVLVAPSATKLWKLCAQWAAHGLKSIC